MRPQLESTDAYDFVDRNLGETAKILAGVRDSDVIQATLAEIAANAKTAAEEKDDNPPAEAPRDGAIAIERQRAFAKAMESFAGLRHDVSNWRFGHSRPSDLEAGYIDTYRESRQRMAKALAKRNDAQLHRWRKLVKYHSYQTRLLANFDDGRLAERREESQTLEEILGKHHDLAMLEGHLASAGRKEMAGIGARKLKRRIRKARKGIEHTAARLGRQLFSKKPRRARKDLSL